MRFLQKSPLPIMGMALFLCCAAAHAQDVIIVANKDVSVSQISSAELRDIFTGARSRFRDGSRAIPVTMKGGPAHEVFLIKHVGVTPDEFRTIWRKAVFTGQGAMLKDFTTEAALLEYISVTPGAIGYVTRTPSRDSVKIINVVRSN